MIMLTTHAQIKRMLLRKRTHRTGKKRYYKSNHNYSRNDDDDYQKNRPEYRQYILCVYI
jgi:hypothetical protein